MCFEYVGEAAALKTVETRNFTRTPVSRFNQLEYRSARSALNSLTCTNEVMRFLS